jgi:hypothetical protein
MPDVRRLLAEKKSDAAILASQNFALKNYIRQLEKALHEEGTSMLHSQLQACSSKRRNDESNDNPRRPSRTPRTKRAREAAENSSGRTSKAGVTNGSAISER